MEDKNNDGAYATSTGELIKFDSDTAGLSLDSGDYLGRSVTTDADNIFIGASRDNTGYSGAGAVYTFGLAAETTLSSTNIKSLAEGTINVSTLATDLAGNTETVTNSFTYNTADIPNPLGVPDLKDPTKHTQHLSLIHISEPTRPY